MKVLCNHTPCGPHFVRSGWARVFEGLGHTFRFWTPGQPSAHDIFSEYEPDLYIGTTYELDRALCKCIAARPALRVLLVASAWGDLADRVNPAEYPLVRASEQEKALVARLKAETGRPEGVFLHVTPTYLDQTLGGWRQAGVEPHGVLNAADLYVYHPVAPREHLRCDVGFCGGYWGYKARNLDRYLLPLCHPQAGLRVKVFGNQPWPVAQYLGLIDDEAVPTLFASATVCPNVSEPHSTDLGFDVVERPFKVLSSGGFCVSDHVDELARLFGEVIPTARRPEDMLRLVKHYVARPQERESMMRLGRELVWAAHTYHDRVAQLLEIAGLPDQAARARLLKLEVLDRITHS